MGATRAIGQQQHPQLQPIVREGLTSLCRVWTAYALKRAIADVASMSDQDYWEFGLDKAEIRWALTRLRDEIKSNEPLAARRPLRAYNSCPLAIVAARRAEAFGRPPSQTKTTRSR